MKEIFLLRREIRAGRADGLSDREIRDLLGDPEEAAAGIRLRYPEYRKSPLRMAPLMLLYASAARLYMEVMSLLRHRAQMITVPVVMEKLGAADLSESSQYVISQTPPAGIEPLFSPAEMIFLCIFGLILGIYFYFFFKYVTRNKAPGS